MKELLARTFKSLKIYNYRLYFIGQLISVTGTWMQNFAIGWYALEISHDSSIVLGIVTAAQFLPVLLLGAFGGSIADRFENRKLLYFTQSTFLILAVLFFVFTQIGIANLYMLGGLSVLFGVVNALDNPTRQSFVQMLAGRNLLPNAVGLNSTLINSARIIGPAAGGIVIAEFGVPPCFLFNALSYLAVIVALALMKADQFFPMQKEKRQKGSVKAGLKYVRNNPNLLIPLINMAIIGTLAYNFQVTLLLLAKNTFKENADGSGLFFSFMGVGAVIGGLIMAGKKSSSNRAYLLAGLIFGVLLMLLAVSPQYYLAALILIPVGILSISYIVLTNTVLQLNSRSDFRGRVMALYAIAFLGSTPIGSVVVSTIAQLLNPRDSIAIGGLSAIFSTICALVYLRIRAAKFAGARGGNISLK